MKNPQFLEGLLLGGRPDSNRRPPEPQSGDKRVYDTDFQCFEKVIKN